MSPLLLLLVLVAARAEDLARPADVNNGTKEILKVAETADPGKVEIVKQIQRLNPDGSYTIGYEADDGTFKIESRDVRGNLKGTYGYIDRDGEIKRVTYSSSSDSTPTPVPVTTTTAMPTVVVRMNKTVSSTTRRPLATVVYPKSSTNRGTVIQPIPRRRPTLMTTSSKSSDATPVTTEKQNAEETTTNILNLYKPKTEETITHIRSQIVKPVKDDLITKQSNVDSTMKTPHTVKPVYEHVNEKQPLKDINKANTIRRELTGTGNPNPHMISLQQSVGDDSTDVYGSHQSLGTVRPLFTTTTPRPRLVPIHSLVAARQQIQQQYREAAEEEQETTIEASTGRVFDHENVVTSNPVPVIHIPNHRDQVDERIYNQPIYRRPSVAAVQFRTEEYMRDNPGSPIPIGNQRPFLNYNYQPQSKVLEPQFVKESAPSPKAAAPEAATINPYDIRPVTRIIPIAVDERGVPIPGYQARFVNPYRQPTQQPPPPIVYQQRIIDSEFDEMNSISAPVSTRDLKRLLHILIYRQNRLQSLMDQIMAPGPPYQPLFRQSEPSHQYNNWQRANAYQVPPQRQYEDGRYDFRYDQQYRQPQQELYTNQIANYEQPQYDSQRFVPRRRLYTRPYDTASASSMQIEENPEYLPPEIREALLLKMLMLAINPDYMPTPASAPITEMTTAAPTRKQVRNVQILGEEGSMDDIKRKMQGH